MESNTNAVGKQNTRRAKAEHTTMVVKTSKNDQASSSTVAVEASVPFLEVPRDDEDWRFAQSFAPVGQEAEARRFYEEYGFAVFRDVLTAEETEASRSEILSYIERTVEGFEAEEPQTWAVWKSKQFGMPAPDPAAWWQPQLCRNRCNPRVAAGFAQLLQCAPETLRCNHDRWALYRVGVKTRRNVHLDISPWAYQNDHAAIAARRAENSYASHDDLYGGVESNLVSSANGPHLQGTLALLPNLEHDAGFLCVPGSHRTFDEWVAQLDSSARGGARHDFPEHSHMMSLAQRVPVREGSLIVWDVRLAHGSQPDQSERGAECRARFVQFVTLRSAQIYDEQQMTRRSALVSRLFAAHSVQEPADPLQRAVAGLVVGGRAAGGQEATGEEGAREQR